jgi:hypothetical protein
MNSVKAEVLIGKRLKISSAFIFKVLGRSPIVPQAMVLTKLTPSSERRESLYTLPGNARLQPGAAPFPFLRTPHQPCLHRVVMDVFSGRVEVPFIAYEAVPVFAMPDPVYSV